MSQALSTRETRDSAKEIKFLIPLTSPPVSRLGPPALAP
jgi:hypothetical protein